MDDRPCLWTPPSRAKTLFVENLDAATSQRQRDAAFQLVVDSAQRGDNMAVDEFTAEFFDLMLRYTDVGVLLYEPPGQFTISSLSNPGHAPLTTWARFYPSKH